MFRFHVGNVDLKMNTLTELYNHQMVNAEYLSDDFDFDLIEQMNKEFVAFSNERTCTYKGCELEKFKLDNPFLFCYVEEKKERECFQDMQ